MKHNEFQQKKLQEIYKTKCFEGLEEIVAGDSWHSLSSPDKSLLAELLILHGQEIVEEKGSRVLDVFAKANEVCNDDPSLHHAQGIVLGSIEHGVYFEAACQCFSKAVALDSDYFEAWLHWGKIVFQQGEGSEDIDLMYRANELFFEASQCSEDDPELIGMLYLTWGMLDSSLGRHHGEAVDFQKALKKFAVAASLGVSSSDFWEHYGHITCELGSLINRPEALLEGKNYFEKAVLSDPKCASARLSLAFSYQKLYEIYANPEYFTKGCASFHEAEKYNEDDSQFWCRWGLLLSLWGRHTYDIEALANSFEKFQNAYDREPDHPAILAKWAEAEIVYGIYNERIDCLKQAQIRIENCLRIEDNNPEAWFIYGTCLNEIGRYFSEPSYFFQAIEKFKYGLHLNPQDVMLTQGIGIAYHALGDMKNDDSLIELSIIYCEKAVQLSKVVAPQLLNDWGVSLMKMTEITGKKEYLEEAVDKFEKALAFIDEDNPDSFDAEWLYNFGCALDFLGDFYDDSHYYEKAIHVLNKFLHFEPSYVHAHYNLASAYSHLGELVGDVDCFHKAIEHFQKYLSEDNEDEVVWNDYGLTLLHLADLLHDPTLPNLSQVCFAQAEEKFLHAVSLGNSQAFYHLACLYSQIEHFPQAFYYLEKAELKGALPPTEEIIEDERLEKLRQTAQFRAFISSISSRRPDN